MSTQDDENVAPEDYTWAMAPIDLALSTSLTLHEAGNLIVGLTWPGIKGLVEISPYDALPLLVTLVHGLRGEADNTVEHAAYALRRLIVNEPPGRAHPRADALTVEGEPA